MNHNFNSSNKSNEKPNNNGSDTFINYSEEPIINSKLSRPPTILPVKIYNELVTNIVKSRKLQNRYQTADLIKPIGDYFILKASTTSGIIPNYAKNLSSVLELLNISKATFYARLKVLEAANLVRRSGGSLIFSSYQFLIQAYEITEVSNITVINYQPKKHKFYELLNASVLYVKSHEIQESIDRKINKVAEFKELIQQRKKQSDSKDLRDSDFLLKLQIENFVNATQTEETELINPDHNVTARYIRKQFNFKSYKSVAYLKKKLQKDGLISVNKRWYTSEGRARKTKQYCAYLNECKATLWRLPDEIIFSGGLFQ